MARFYIGQPVVCVWDKSQWSLSSIPTQIPKVGSRYTVRYTGVCFDGNTRLMLKELPGSQWNENGFAPITEDTVRGIIEEAVKGPRTVRKLEDVE